jgi:hypothetical protein
VVQFCSPVLQRYGSTLCSVPESVTVARQQLMGLGCWGSAGYAQPCSIALCW